MANQHSNKPILIAREGKLLPLYMEPPGVGVTADIVLGGCASVTNILSGRRIYCYQPSFVHSINLDGHALVVSEIGGILCVDYTPAPFGYITGGAADVVTDITPVVERGGKGTPRPRRKPQQQKQIWIYNAHAYFDSTIQIGGSADAMFIPAKYTFIKSLPRVPTPELEKEDSEFRKVYRELLLRKPTKTFTYEPDGVSNLSFNGRADQTFFDFSEWIISLDDDYIIADALSVEGNPFITTVFDRDNKIRIAREDDELLNILELL